MKLLEDIQKYLLSGHFDFSRHAFKRAIERNISESEIREAARETKIIEDYPDDKYSPSYLLLGFTKKQRPLHIQVSLADTETVKIITIYEPNEDEWIDFSKRR